MRSYLLITVVLVLFSSGVAGQETRVGVDTSEVIQPKTMMLENQKIDILRDLKRIEVLLQNQNLNGKNFDFDFEEKNASLYHKAKPFLLPVGLMSLSLYTMSSASAGSFLNKNIMQNKLQLRLPHNFNTSLDDYLQHMPIVITGGLKFAGIKGKNDAVNSVLLASKSKLLTSLIVTQLKGWAKVQRPDASSNTSFPSGHTANAFCNATIMHMEFGELSPWYSIAAYGMATATGALRMANNVHWFPDVLAGAAIGIATTRLVYATHRYKWGKKPSNLVVVPSVSSKGLGLNLAYTF